MQQLLHEIFVINANISKKKVRPYLTESRYLTKWKQSTIICTTIEHEMFVQWIRVDIFASRLK